MQKTQTNVDFYLFYQIKKSAFACVFSVISVPYLQVRMH